MKAGSLATIHHDGLIEVEVDEDKQRALDWLDFLDALEGV